MPPARAGGPGRHGPAPKEGGPALRGKPKLDEKLLRQYVLLGARDADLAALLDISVSTLRRGFGEALKKIRAEKRNNVRKMVWKKAQDGNTALITWLAKHELEKEDVPVVEKPTRRKRFDFKSFAEEFKKFHGETQQAGERPAQADGSGEPVRPDHPDGQAGDLPHDSAG